jgi:hypothetical protein
MNRRSWSICAALFFALVTPPGTASAQVPSVDTLGDMPFDPAAHVRRFDLSGPRAGVLIGPNGYTTSQFGWHFESQANADRKGPWFIVERVLLVGGVEQQLFLPSATVVFGMRMPDGFEVGLGPSVSFGGERGASTALVLAAGRSFRAGGISVPVNFALSTNRYGSRFSILTGWAIRDDPTPR